MKPEILQQAVMDSRDGITISDNCPPDNPLIFMNPAFERLTGYSLISSSSTTATGIRRGTTR
ncbi:MAG TPA: PAS domain-containing protein [Rhodanobacter sp.]|nr:PAS domain-containing protein [Rhodanobacter sp.]